MSEIELLGQSCPAKRGKVGRPTMLDINKAYGVMHSIRETGSIEGAAALNGISATTYYNWMRHGKRMTEWEAQGNRLDPEDEPFAILYRNVNETLAQIELTNYEIVKQAAGPGSGRRPLGYWNGDFLSDGAEEAVAVAFLSR